MVDVKSNSEYPEETVLSKRKKAAVVICLLFTLTTVIVFGSVNFIFRQKCDMKILLDMTYTQEGFVAIVNWTTDAYTLDGMSYRVYDGEGQLLAAERLSSILNSTGDVAFDDVAPWGIVSQGDSFLARGFPTARSLGLIDASGKVVAATNGCS